MQFFQWAQPALHPRGRGRPWRGVVLSLILALGLVGSAAPAAASAGIRAATPPVDNPADYVRGMEYWLDMSGVRQTWPISTGEGVTIAIIDTGIARLPAVFGGAVVGGVDVSGVGTPDGRTPVGAVDGNHGTWVASLAGARGSADGAGMIGVAPDVNLLSVSVGFSAVSAVPFSKQIAEAIIWSVDNGADIINLSFTTNTPDWDTSWDHAFQHAFDNDVVVIVAAGNRGSGTNVVGAPATIPGVLTVAGVDKRGNASKEASTQGITIGVSAPSEDLLGVSADGELVLWNGTSGAAPIVSGIAALVRSAHPDLNAQNVINRLISTATPGPSGQVPDPLYGYGLVNAYAAVTADVEWVEDNPMGSLAEWIRLHRRAVVDPVPTPTEEHFELPALPPADAPTQAQTPLVPRTDTLLYGTLPLVLFTMPAILIGLGVTAAARRIRLSRAQSVHPQK